MGKSRIILLQLKQLILMGILLLFVILLILVLVVSFRNEDKNSTETLSGSVSSVSNDSLYIPGVYTSSLTLSDTVLNIEVTVDDNYIKDIKITNLSESITTMYPLLESSLSTITAQLKSGTPIEDVVLSSDSIYTGQILLNSINGALNSAKSSKKG